MRFTARPTGFSAVQDQIFSGYPPYTDLFSLPVAHVDVAKLPTLVTGVGVSTLVITDYLPLLEHPEGPS